MATASRTSTPPPPSNLHTPSTPRYGKDDTYEPYSPRRKSARVSSQRSAQTPPHLSRATHSPRFTKRKAAYSGIATSPPSSPQTAPKKNTPKNSPIMGGRRVSGALNYENTADAANTLGIPAPRNSRKMEAQRSAIRSNGMLPTPAKTPKKRANESNSAITSVARSLFPIRGEASDEIMPSPKKKGRKRYTGFTMDSFEAEGEDPIAIYTDSHDRVPEVDTSSDNPFYGEASTPLPDPVKRSSKRRKITIPGEEEKMTIEDAERRDDGLVYVFRGKKIFRKFTAEDPSGDDDQEHDSFDQEELDEEIKSKQLDRPLTRSSIQPRLLFPTRQQLKAKEMRSQATEDEEEAVTDIEEQTSMDHTDEIGATPKAPKFAPASPPITARVTRSKDVIMGSSPVAQTSDDDDFAYPSRSRSGNNSPFNGWRQTKSVGGAKKRGGERLIKGKGVKKPRG